MVVFLSFTFSFVFLHPPLSCLGIIGPFPFSNFVDIVSWHSVLELDGKRKEYSARSRYQSEYKKRDVAGKFNILTKSGAHSSSCLGVGRAKLSGRQAGEKVLVYIFSSNYIGHTGKSYTVFKEWILRKITSPIRCWCCFLAKNGRKMVFQCRLAHATLSIPTI